MTHHPTNPTPRETGHHPRHMRRDDTEPDGMNADTTGESRADVETPAHPDEESH